MRYASKITIITTLLSCAFAVILVPIVSNFLSSQVQMQTVQRIENSVAKMEPQILQEELNNANEYNQLLAKGDAPQKELNESYQRALNFVDGMGYIDIPCINAYYPIYHGTGNAAISSGVGHVEGTSLPVGGKSTHASLAAHSGLDSAKLFSELPNVKMGDKFYVHICGEVLCYTVDDIRTIEPDDVNCLKIVEGKDYVTLITCVPIGVNTHRLLVRGTRSYEDTLDNSIQNTDDVSATVNDSAGDYEQGALSFITPTNVVKISWVLMGLTVVIFNTIVFVLARHIIERKSGKARLRNE